MHPKNVRRGWAFVACLLVAAAAPCPQARAGETGPLRTAALHQSTAMVDPFVGWFAVEGTSPGGRAYSGKVSITREGTGYRVVWMIDSRFYLGKGKLRSGRLLVDWGKAKPVIYVPGDDGSLRGSWDGGRGREELKPSSRSGLEG